MLATQDLGSFPLQVVLEEPVLVPEQRLLLAVLEEALHTFQSGLGSRCPQRRREFVEVERWISDRDGDCPLSFDYVCTIVGIDPDYLRAGLLQLKRRAVLDGIAVPSLRVRRRAAEKRSTWKGRIGSQMPRPRRRRRRQAEA